MDKLRGPGGAELRSERFQAVTDKMIASTAPWESVRLLFNFEEGMAPAAVLQHALDAGLLSEDFARHVYLLFLRDEVYVHTPWFLALKRFCEDYYDDPEIPPYSDDKIEYVVIFNQIARWMTQNVRIAACLRWQIAHYGTAREVLLALRSKNKFTHSNVMPFYEFMCEKSERKESAPFKRLEIFCRHLEQPKEERKDDRGAPEESSRTPVQSAASSSATVQSAAVATDRIPDSRELLETTELMKMLTMITRCRFDRLLDRQRHLMGTVLFDSLRDNASQVNAAINYILWAESLDTRMKDLKKTAMELQMEELFKPPSQDTSTALQSIHYREDPAPAIGGAEERFRRLLQMLIRGLTHEALDDLKILFGVHDITSDFRVVERLNEDGHISARSVWKVVHALRDCENAPWRSCGWYRELLAYHEEVCGGVEEPILDPAPELYAFVHLRRCLIQAPIPIEALVLIWDAVEMGGTTPRSAQEVLDELSERGYFSAGRVRRLAQVLESDELLQRVYGRSRWYHKVVAAAAAERAPGEMPARQMSVGTEIARLPSVVCVGCTGAYSEDRLQETLEEIASLTHFPAMRWQATSDVLAAVAGSSCVVACAWTGEQAGGAEGGERWGCWLARDVLGHRSTSHVPWIVWSEEVVSDFQYHREIHGLGGLSVREEPQVQVVRGLVAAVVRQGLDRAAAVRADGERLEQEERGRLERLRAELHTREVTPRNVQQLLLGQARVGKTCLYRALQGLAFKDECESTVDHEAADLALDGAGVLRRPSAGAGPFDCLDSAYLGALEAHKDARSSRGEEAEQSAGALPESCGAESGESISRPAHPKADSHEHGVAHRVNDPSAESERPNPQTAMGQSVAAELSAEEKRMQACFDGTKVPLGADEMVLRAFDFAGQEQYYATHHIYLRNGAVCLLVFRVRDFVSRAASSLRNESGLSAEEYIIFWLSSLRLCAPEAAVLLVGVYCTNIAAETREAHFVEESDVAEQMKKCDDVLSEMDYKCNLFVSVKRRKTGELFFALETPKVRAAVQTTRASNEMGELWSALCDAAKKKLSNVGQLYPWFQAYMRMKELEDVFLTVGQVGKILAEFVVEEKVDEFLEYFHNLGRTIVAPASGCCPKIVLPNAKRISNAFGMLLDSVQKWKLEKERARRRWLQVLSDRGEIERECLIELLSVGSGISELDAKATLDCFLRFGLVLSRNERGERDTLLIPSCAMNKDSRIPDSWSACKLVFGFEICAFLPKIVDGQCVLIPCLLVKLVVKLLPELPSDMQDLKSVVTFRRNHAVLHGLRGFSVCLATDFRNTRIECRLVRMYGDDNRKYAPGMTPDGACAVVKKALAAIVKETFTECGRIEVKYGPCCQRESCGTILENWRNVPICNCGGPPAECAGCDISCWTNRGGFSKEELGGCSSPTPESTVSTLYGRLKNWLMADITNEALEDLKIVFELTRGMCRIEVIQQLQKFGHISERSVWKVVHALRDCEHAPWLSCLWYCELLKYHKESCNGVEGRIEDPKPERYKFAHLRRCLIQLDIPMEARAFIWQIFVDMVGTRDELTPGTTEETLNKLEFRGHFAPKSLASFAQALVGNTYLVRYKNADWYKKIAEH